MDKVGRGTTTVSMVDQLRSKGILCNKDDFTFNSVLNSTIFKGIDVEANMARKKVVFLKEIQQYENAVSFLVLRFTLISFLLSFFLFCSFLSSSSSSSFILLINFYSFMLCNQMAAAVLSLAPSDAHKLLTLLVDMWQSGFVFLLPH